MQILTESDFKGYSIHPDNHFWNILNYKNGGISIVPKNFFVTWQNDEVKEGNFYIGKCTAIGRGSTVRYDNRHQMLKIGRYVSIGGNVRFILNGTHSINYITTFNLEFVGLTDPKPVDILGDTLVQDDVWIGEEAMIMGGVIIENGCIVGARSLVTQRSKLEPYGIYAGNPAKLIRFRFDPKIIELLLEIKWWEQPFDWVRNNLDLFKCDLSEDIGKSLEILQELKKSKDDYLLNICNLLAQSELSTN